MWFDIIISLLLVVFSVWLLPWACAHFNVLPWAAFVASFGVTVAWVAASVKHSPSKWGALGGSIGVLILAAASIAHESKTTDPIYISSFWLLIGVPIGAPAGALIGLVGGILVHEFKYPPSKRTGTPPGN